jgi:hypothetical protein
VRTLRPGEGSGEGSRRQVNAVWEDGRRCSWPRSGDIATSWSCCWRAAPIPWSGTRSVDDARDRARPGRVKRQRHAPGARERQANRRGMRWHRRAVDGPSHSGMTIR